MLFLCSAALITLLALTVAMATDNYQAVTVTRSDDGRWLEVYHDGQLTAEWQRSDGAVFDSLEILLDNDYESLPVPPLSDQHHLRIRLATL